MSGVEGRTCLVTGASSGIGLAAARALAARGASLILLCRSRERGRAAVTEVRRAVPGAEVELVLCDLASLEQVRRAAAQVLAGDRPLHVLLHNAGVFNLRRRVTEDGLEEMFAVNHLAPFLLTCLLLERVVASAPARIVVVASDAHRSATLEPDDLNALRRWRPMWVYGRSKLANILFTRELARRLQGTGVTANALHPGVVATGIGSGNGRWVSVLMTLARPFLRTPEQGAETAVHLCAAPELEGVTGRYYRDLREHAPAPAARSDPDAARLWDLSARLAGIGDRVP